MASVIRRSLVLVAALAAAATVVSAADSGQRLFEKRWAGRRVVVKQSLYTLVFNERGRGNDVRAGRRAGLTVVTPFNGIYFQFDGRRHVDDVVERDVQRIPKSVKTAYLKDHPLDEGWFQDVDPIMLARYDAGVELMVRAAHVDRDTVRLDLVQPANSDEEVGTSLTIKWPAPLSKSFSERDNVEALIRQFLIAADL